MFRRHILRKFWTFTLILNKNRKKKHSQSTFAAISRLTIPLLFINICLNILWCIAIYQRVQKPFSRRMVLNSFYILIQFSVRRIIIKSFLPFTFILLLLLLFFKWDHSIKNSLFSKFFFFLINVQPPFLMYLYTGICQGRTVLVNLGYHSNTSF